MLERIDFPGEQQLRFVFPAGGHGEEQYTSSLSFCPSPTCSCGLVDLSVVPDGRVDTAAAGPECHFQVDILDRKLVSAGKKSSKFNQDFGKAFVSRLEERDWELLYELFDLYKRRIFEQARDEELDTNFPESEIEQDSLMIGFDEILPFAESRTIELDGKHYLLHDQYCVRMGCGCSEIAVNLIQEWDVEKDLDTHPAVFVDYKSGKCRTMEQGGQGRAFFRQVADKLKARDYPAWFLNRHSRMRSLYRLYRQGHSSTKSLPARAKVGRNEPCPCGSGKKHKKCCLSRAQ